MMVLGYDGGKYKEGSLLERIAALRVKCEESKEMPSIVLLDPDEWTELQSVEAIGPRKPRESGNFAGSMVLGMSVYVRV